MEDSGSLEMPPIGANSRSRKCRTPRRALKKEFSFIGNQYCVETGDNETI